MDKRIIFLSIPAAIINLLIFTYLKTKGVSYLIMLYLALVSLLGWTVIIEAIFGLMDGDDK